MDFKKAVKMAAIDKGMKMSDVARAAGYTPQTFAVSLSRGISTIALAEKILDALDCELVVVDKKTKKVY